MKRIAFDTETYPIRSSGKATILVVPKVVCLSWSDGTDSGVMKRDDAVEWFSEKIQDPGVELVAHNAVFDLNVMIEACDDPDAGRWVRDALLADRIHDTIIREQLVDIARGGIFTRGGYTLKQMAKRLLDVDVGGKKGPDVWRARYNELDDVPLDQWPRSAYEYARKDAVYTLRMFDAQRTRYGDRIRRWQAAFQMRSDWMLSLMGTWGLMCDTDYALKVDGYFAAEEEKWADVLRREGIMVDGTVKQAKKRDLIGRAWESVGVDPKRTKTGLVATDKDTIRELERKYDVEDPGFEAIIGHNRTTKYRATYLDPIIDAGDYPLEPRYNVLVNTGRTSSCISEGTMIQVVGAGTEGKPIEDVEAGDLVWCFDDDLQPRIEPVQWAGKTGHEHVVRVHWQSQGRRGHGYIDCTPDHLVRKTDGSWCRADELEEGDHVMAVSRGLKGDYIYAYATGGHMLREHRFAYEQVHGESPEVVHHRNGDKTDNRIENLEAMDRASHASHHIGDFSREELRQRGDHLKRWRESASPKELEAVAQKNRGPRNPGWLGLSYTWLLSKLFEYAGRPKIMADAEGIDFDTLKGYFDREGVDVDSVRSFFNGRNEFMDQEFVDRGRALKENGVRQPDVLKAVGLGFYRWKAIQEEYGYKPYNHRVMGVERLEGTTDVYDLHVPPYSNFIANEICVHNSGPNVQNFPSRTKVFEQEALDAWYDENPDGTQLERIEDGVVVGPDIRGCFVPRDGCVFVGADYSALELATLAQVLRNARGELTELGKAINRELDLHCVVGATLMGVSYERFVELYEAGDSEAKRLRDVSKVINYSAPVGAYTKTIKEQGEKQGVYQPMSVWKKAHDAWKEAFPEMVWYQESYIPSFQRSYHGPYWVEQHGPDRATQNWRLRMCDKRTEAANTPFQGLAGDGAKYAGWLLMEGCRFEQDCVLYGSKPVLFVHDEYVLECPADKAEACGEELSRRMVQGMKKFVPDILIEADYDIYEDRWAK